MKCPNIIKGKKKDFAKLLAIWESAVRTTHDFLDNKDFIYYQSRMTVYFEKVDLYVYKNENGEIVGFMGVSGSMLEMLFVDAAFRGCGVGRKLLHYAVDKLNVCKLDVNEQNNQAIDFYTHMGFKIIGRSPLDNEGKPYPLLHLQYDANKTINKIKANITRIPTDKKRFLELLLLGDEQESMIDRYLERGEMFVLEENGIKAVCVVTDEGEGTCELKNIAVVPDAQRQGYGKKLIDFLIAYYSGKYDRMLVGTGDVSSTLAFYLHCGFTYSHRVENFFINHYDHLIIEDGVQLKDMVYLKYMMNKSFSIRVAQQSDAIELKDLFQNTVRTINKRNYSQEEVEDWASCGNDISRIEDMINTHYFIIAVNQKLQIVGFSSITPKGYLHNMFVHKDFQGKGVASVLLNEIERFAAVMGIKRITSEVSLTARPFFEKRGFVVEKEQKRKANKFFLTNFVMTKELNNK